MHCSNNFNNHWKASFIETYSASTWVTIHNRDCFFFNYLWYCYLIWRALYAFFGSATMGAIVIPECVIWKSDNVWSWFSNINNLTNQFCSFYIMSLCSIIVNTRCMYHVQTLHLLVYLTRINFISISSIFRWIFASSLMITSYDPLTTIVFLSIPQLDIL